MFENSANTNTNTIIRAQLFKYSNNTNIRGNTGSFWKRSTPSDCLVGLELVVHQHANIQLNPVQIFTYSDSNCSNRFSSYFSEMLILILSASILMLLECRGDLIVQTPSRAPRITINILWA